MRTKILIYPPHSSIEVLLCPVLPPLFSAKGSLLINLCENRWDVYRPVPNSPCVIFSKGRWTLPVVN